MTTSDEPAGLKVPERIVPVPSSVSPEAQAYLAMGPFPSPPSPALDDVEGWREMIATTNRMVLAMFANSGELAPPGFQVEELDVSGIPVYEITPPDLQPDDHRIFMDPHGGAFIVGGGSLCIVSGAMSAAKCGMRVWSVDYRMPPDHPYPAAVDDCMAVYRALLERHPPEELVLGGVSAGGNLAAATILRARDEGLPMPAAAVLLTPAMDLTHSGDTFHTNRGVDTVLTDGEGGGISLYAGGHDRRVSYLSPVFGDFAQGFPPSLLASGTRDVLLSDTVRFHRALRAANIQAELHVLEAAPHGFFRGRAPEDRELAREVRRFVEERCPSRRVAVDG
jgi:monoterpene epsilon-lactone hydrolase